jgi:hypothetical protein
MKWEVSPLWRMAERRDERVVEERGKGPEWENA